MSVPSLSASPLSSLPVPLTPLVGRQQESRDAERLLADPAVRLLTLTGPGGVGKSRLALRVAANVSDAFDGDVVFVPLASVQDPALAPATFAHALGIPDSGGEPLDRILRDRLRHRRLLFVVDNFEQVREAATLVAALLAACPHIKALVTGRAPLSVYGEHLFPVPPLATPEGQHPTAAEAALADAVTLFVQRTRAVRPVFVLTDDIAPAVAEICRRLDGLPLAIELAAARGKVLSPPVLLARLSRRLHVLTGGVRDAPDRLRTMQNAIGWSYDLLAPDERALFRRMAVFAGGCDLDAIEAVCGEGLGSSDAILTRVEALIDHSLARQVRGTGEASRFGMLETIREYALEQLEASGEAEEIRRRHAAWCLGVAGRVEAGLLDPAPDAILTAAEGELDNLRTALAWALRQAESETALRLTCGLWLFWVQRGHVGEGARWFEQSLDRGAAAAADVRAWRAKAMLGLAGLAERQGDIQRAEELGERGLALYQALEDSTGIGQAHCLLGGTTLRQGDIERAITSLRTAVSYFASGPDNQIWLALSLGLLALAVADGGDEHNANQYLEQAHAIRRQMGDRWPLTFPLPEPGQSLQRVNEGSEPPSQVKAADVADGTYLTPREREVLRLVAEGHTSREIADALFISPRTATTHIGNIMTKLDVPSRPAAVSHALRHGLI